MVFIRVKNCVAGMIAGFQVARNNKFSQTRSARHPLGGKVMLKKKTPG
jgi:hypothetical protein